MQENTDACNFQKHILKFKKCMACNLDICTAFQKTGGSENNVPDAFSEYLSQL